MSAVEYSLRPGRILQLLMLTFQMKLGLRKVDDTYSLTAAGVWQAIWAALILGALTLVYPATMDGAWVLAIQLSMQLLSMCLVVLVFVWLLRMAGLDSRKFLYIVPFLWIDNLQTLFGGLAQNFVLFTGELTYLVLLLPLVVWNIYWQWRVGRDQLGRGGWFSAGLLLVAMFIEIVLFAIVQSRIEIPTQ